MVKIRLFTCQAIAWPFARLAIASFYVVCKHKFDFCYFPLLVLLLLLLS